MVGFKKVAKQPEGSRSPYNTIDFDSFRTVVVDSHLCLGDAIAPLSLTPTELTNDQSLPNETAGPDESSTATIRCP
jgi:hypothetical protein